jgi:hypothetical protein
MSHIFNTETKTTTRPRHDATIRVKLYRPGGTQETGQYIDAELLEFHPDYDTRLKFRSYALVRPRPELTRPEHAHIYRMCGEGYLEQPYISINEVFIHMNDLVEMMDYCRKQPHPAAPLVIHPCPLPFPMFAKGDRVVCIKAEGDGLASEAHIGQTATVAEDSSAGNGTMVTFDLPELNKGHDGRIYPAIGFMSSNLRKLEQGEHLQVVISKRKHQRKGKPEEGSE